MNVDEAESNTNATPLNELRNVHGQAARTSPEQPL